MNRLLLSVVAFLILGLSVARADVILPPPPPPKPPTKPTTDTTTVVAGATATLGLVFAGVWLIRLRRRIAIAS